MASAIEEKRIEDELSYPIMLAERVRTAVDDADSFKTECGEVKKQVDWLSQSLRTVVRLTTSAQSVYERPVRRVISEVSKNLERAITLVRKCKRRNIFRRVVNIVSAADFRKLSNLLDASVGDMRWLLNIFETENGGAGIVLPPIASNDPILSWIWSYIAMIHMGSLSDRIEAANALASLATDHRNKKIIVEEGGVSPLLKLLKEAASPEAQMAAATCLYNLANDQERVSLIVSELGVPIIVNVLGDSTMKVQIQMASLVARMAEYDPLARDDFARENVIRPLVTLLSFEDTLVEDDHHGANSGKQSIHSIVQINKQLEESSSSGGVKNYRPYMNLYSESSTSSRSGQNRRDRENEKPEMKAKLKITCALALWMLARGSVSNSRRITETKGLLCLAKLVEKEDGDLQLNCLMTIMEITAAAEFNADLRRAAFKTNSPAAKAVVDQLLRVIKDLDDPTLQIAAMKSIGSLARTFPARETRVIGPLVDQLSNRNAEVATEAAVALQKFACSENFLCMEHSKAIIEFNGVRPLMRLLRGDDQTQLQGLVLLCYLALHAGNSEALEQARVLTALEGADRTVVAHPELKELVLKATNHLTLYRHSGVHSQRHVSFG